MAKKKILGDITSQVGIKYGRGTRNHQTGGERQTNKETSKQKRTLMPHATSSCVVTFY